MTLVFSAARRLGNTAFKINHIIHLRENLSLIRLGNRGVETLSKLKSAAISESPNARVVRSIGLVSCASVCYVNTMSKKGYVFHANAGNVDKEDFLEAMKQINAALPYDHTYIVYAHRSPTGDDYQEVINRFINYWRFPTNNMVEIRGLIDTSFGMNNHLQFGY